MKNDDWLKKWETGDTRFHQTKVHPELLKNAERFAEGTILVPLSGKSLDMLFLASRNHKVIGAELSELACRSFFEENDIQYTLQKINDFLIFESEKITLYCGDFFNLPDKVWSEISGIYDRAALIALPPEIRIRYADFIKQNARKGTQILLITIEYPDQTIQGPPFSVPFAEISESYKQFDIKSLNFYGPDDMKSHPTFKEVPVRECVYWLTKT